MSLFLSHFSQVEAFQRRGGRRLVLQLKELLVGPPGFEPGTSCTPSKRASQAAPRPETYIVHAPRWNTTPTRSKYNAGRARHAPPADKIFLTKNGLIPYYRSGK
jgi:hypothetical protein